MDIHVLFYYIGIILIVWSNLMTLRAKGGRYAGFPMPQNVITLFGSVLIAYYFMFREGYIQF